MQMAYEQIFFKQRCHRPVSNPIYGPKQDSCTNNNNIKADYVYAADGGF